MNMRKDKNFSHGRFSKQSWAEGPLSEANSSNHIYVFGAKSDPSREEMQARHAIAAHATDWAFDRGFEGRVMFVPGLLRITVYDKAV